MNAASFQLLISAHRGQFEDMCAQDLMRVEMPLKAALEHSSRTKRLTSLLMWWEDKDP